MFFGKNVRKRHGKDPELINRLFLRLGIWRLKPCCFDWKTVCCGKVSRCDANETKLRLEVLVSFFNCYCAPRRTRKTTIPTICGWCAVCGLRARRFRHRTIFPPVFIRWAGPWCMRLGVDGNPRSWWHFNAWFRNGRTRGDPIRIFRLCFLPLWRLPHGPPQQRHRSTKTGGWTLRVWPARPSLWYADVAGRQHARGYPWVAH